MDALKAIAQRRSWRKFDGRLVPRDALEQLAEAGRLAATARNEQPWEFIAVTDRAKLREVGGITDHGKFIADAGACIAVYCRDTKYYLEDGCAATQNILVAAAALGLRSCWVAGDKKAYGPAVSRTLGVPEDLKLVALVALGYGEGEAQPPAKRSLESVLHWERF